MDARERLNQLIREYGGTQKRFASLIGVSQPSVANWMAMNKIPERGITKILAACPEVDFDWLTGKSALPGRLGVALSVSEVRAAAGTPCGASAGCVDFPGAPFYPYLPASAGQLDMGDEDHTKERIVIPGTQTDAYFPVVGNSMDPTIQNGDTVGVRRLDSLELIRPNNIYLIFTSDNERMLKRIRSIDRNDAWLTLYSDNPTYEPFQVLKSQITAIYKAVCLIRQLG